jgi:hypothetical protein
MFTTCVNPSKLCVCCVRQCSAVRLLLASHSFSTQVPHNGVAQT